MNMYYPIDSNGNPLAFRVPAAFVYGFDGESLLNKLNNIETIINGILENTTYGEILISSVKYNKENNKLILYANDEEISSVKVCDIPNRLEYSRGTGLLSLYAGDTLVSSTNLVVSDDGSELPMITNINSNVKRIPVTKDRPMYDCTCMWDTPNTNDFFYNNGELVTYEGCILYIGYHKIRKNYTDFIDDNENINILAFKNFVRSYSTREINDPSITNLKVHDFNAACFLYILILPKFSDGIINYKVKYGVNFIIEPVCSVYGFKISYPLLNDECIEYICDNENYTPLSFNYDTGEPDYGDWLKNFWFPDIYIRDDSMMLPKGLYSVNGDQGNLTTIREYLKKAELNPSNYNFVSSFDIGIFVCVKEDFDIEVDTDFTGKSIKIYFSEIQYTNDFKLDFFDEIEDSEGFSYNLVYDCFRTSVDCTTYAGSVSTASTDEMDYIWNLINKIESTDCINNLNSYGVNFTPTIMSYKQWAFLFFMFMLLFKSFNVYEKVVKYSNCTSNQTVVNGKSFEHGDDLLFNINPDDKTYRLFGIESPFNSIQSGYYIGGITFKTHYNPSTKIFTYNFYKDDLLEYPVLGYNNYSIDDTNHIQRNSKTGSYSYANLSFSNYFPLYGQNLSQDSNHIVEVYEASYNTDLTSYSHEYTYLFYLSYLNNLFRINISSFNSLVTELETSKDYSDLGIADRDKNYQFYSVYKTDPVYYRKVYRIKGWRDNL